MSLAIRGHFEKFHPWKFRIALSTLRFPAALERQGAPSNGAPARRDGGLHDHRFVPARPYTAGHVELIEAPLGPFIHSSRSF